MSWAWYIRERYSSKRSNVSNPLMKAFSVLYHLKYRIGSLFIFSTSFIFEGIKFVMDFPLNHFIYKYMKL